MGEAVGDPGTVMEFLPEIHRGASAAWRRSAFVRRHLDEDDARQEAVLHCLRYGERYRSGTVAAPDYYAYLAMQGVWRAVEKAKRRVVRNMVTVSHNSSLPDRPCAETDPDLTLDAGWFLSVLAPQVRLVVELCCLGGLKVRQAARVLGMPGTTAQRYFRAAVAKLRKAFPEYVTGKE